MDGGDDARTWAPIAVPGGLFRAYESRQTFHRRRYHQARWARDLVLPARRQLAMFLSKTFRVGKAARPRCLDEAPSARASRISFMARFPPYGQAVRIESQARLRRSFFKPAPVS